jgi:hypothetical protein
VLSLYLQVDPAMFSQARHGGGEDQTSHAETRLQAEKLESVLGLLLSAGYFRARAPGLEPFDKVRDVANRRSAL